MGWAVKVPSSVDGAFPSSREGGRALHGRGAPILSGPMSAQAHVTPPPNPGEAAIVGTPPSAGPAARPAWTPTSARRGAGLGCPGDLLFHFIGQMVPTNWVESAIVGVTKYGERSFHPEARRRVIWPAWG